MNLQDINLKSTKKEIFEAYEAILEEIKERKGKNIEFKESGAQGQAVLEAETAENKNSNKHIGAEKYTEAAVELNVDKIVGEISGLKININNILNKLNDRIMEEFKKLDSVKQAIKDENEKLENIYKIKAEANTLFDLAEIKDQKTREYKKLFEEDEEKVISARIQKEKEWQREQEEYIYNLKTSRKKEEDDYEFKRQMKEREFNEKIAVREKELKIREIKILEQENEIKEIKTKMEAFSLEIEKAVQETEKRAKAEFEKEAAVSREMLMKDVEKERELSKFKIASLEDMVKRQGSQINILENELKSAISRSQELAVKIIEYSREPRQTDKKDDSQKKE